MIPRDDPGRTSSRRRSSPKVVDRPLPPSGNGDSKASDNGGGWGLNYVQVGGRKSFNRSHKGSFVDLLEGDLSELHLVDAAGGGGGGGGGGGEEGRESSATTSSGMSLTSSNPEHMASSSSTSDSSRPSSSSAGSSENVLEIMEQPPSSHGRRHHRARTPPTPDEKAAAPPVPCANVPEIVCAEETMVKPRNEQLFLAVKKNDEATVRRLHEAGVSLESVDKYGMTPLMVACLDGNLNIMAQGLITLGANVHAYRHGTRAGFPLHHAAKRGHEKNVRLLLESGANALAANDDGQTALDMARIGEHASAVRVIEDWICLFKGVLRQITDHAGSQIMKRTWAVVLSAEGSRRELVVYSSRKVATPESVILLGSLTSEIEEPDFEMSDPSLVVSDKLAKTKFKFFAQDPGDRKQLTAFYRACRGLTHKSQAQVQLPSLGDTRNSAATAAAGSVIPRCRSEKPVQKKNSVFPEESLSKVQKHRCLVCKKVPAEAISIPCGHLSACTSCLSGLKKNGGACPVCQAPIQHVVKLVTH